MWLWTWVYDAESNELPSLGLSKQDMEAEKRMVALVLTIPPGHSSSSAPSGDDEI